MKLLVLYRPYSEHGRPVEDFVHEFTRRNPEVRVEMLNIDSRDGSALASLYDVTAYPGILALKSDGSAAEVWQGASLPLIDEVASYAAL